MSSHVTIYIYIYIIVIAMDHLHLEEDTARALVAQQEEDHAVLVEDILQEDAHVQIAAIALLLEAPVVLPLEGDALTAETMPLLHHLLLTMMK
jgi:hypothetical protein